MIPTDEADGIGLVTLGTLLECIKRCLKCGLGIAESVFSHFHHGVAFFSPFDEGGGNAVCYLRPTLLRYRTVWQHYQTWPSTLAGEGIKQSETCRYFCEINHRQWRDALPIGTVGFGHDDMQEGRNRCERVMRRLK